MSPSDAFALMTRDGGCVLVQFDIELLRVDHGSAPKIAPKSENAFAAPCAAA
jgi:hypothetical protein